MTNFKTDSNISSDIKSLFTVLQTLYKISSFFARYITLIVILVTAVSLIFPESFDWIGTSCISPLLGVVMFGMGLTLTASDFRTIMMRPKDIIIGELAQFIIMPSLAWLLCRVLHLPTDIALGVILVGCCPGGTASNIFCFLAKGDTALSVAISSVSTLLAPIITPALVYLLAGKEVGVDMAGMFLSIVQVIILPIIMGLLVNHYFRQFAEKATPLLPMFSAIAIIGIIGSVVSNNAAHIMSCSLIVGIAIILHNVLGLILGLLAAKAVGMNAQKQTAVSIEVGMQNAGLATSLATTHFALFPMAAVPGAIFSAWHNFSGSITAALFRRINDNSNRRY